MADKLGVSVFDLSDSTVMRTVREELDIGVVTAVPGLAKGLEAKARIADLLGIRINSVERLKAKTGLGAPWPDRRARSSTTTVSARPALRTTAGRVRSTLRRLRLPPHGRRSATRSLRTSGVTASPT